MRKEKSKRQRVLEHLTHSDEALFVEEISRNVGLTGREVASALFDLCRFKKVKKKGWFDPYRNMEAKYENRGWLYYVNLKQLENRMGKRNLLTGVKQKIYEEVLANSKLQKRFTSRQELSMKVGASPQHITDYTSTLKHVYPDLRSIEVGNETYYYIDGLLSEEEIAREKDYKAKVQGDRQSFKTLLGRCHEKFGQIALDEMWKNGDLKIKDAFWEFTVKGGEKKFNVYKSRVSNPNRIYEFDRVLHLILERRRNYLREIIMVFEMKYRGILNEQHVSSFLQKLSDTYEFGAEATMKDIHGNQVHLRIPRFNVVPVLVVPHKGEAKIEVQVGKNTRKVNFAEYCTLLGIPIIFTSEFEEYLQQRLGKKISFKRTFNTWFHSSKETIDFTKYLLEYLNQPTRETL